MADTQDVQEILLRVKSDKSTITSALRDLGQVKTGIKDLGNVSFNSLQSRIDKTTKEFADLRAEIKATADEVDNLKGKDTGAAGGFSGKRSAEGIGNIAGLVGQLGGADLSGPIRAAAEISRVTEVLPQLAEQFTALGPLGIAAAAGVGVAAAAVALLDQQSKGLSDTVRGLIAGQKEYFDLINKGSKEDLQQAIKQKQNDLEVAKKQRDELVKLQADAFAEAQKQFGDFGARIAEQGARSFNVAAINDQDKAINDLNATIAEQEFALGRLTGAQRASITATNDLAIAQKAQLAEFIANAKTAAERQSELAKFERTASTQQLADRVASNEERLTGLKLEADRLLSVSETSKEARDRLAEIQAETNKLTAENDLLNGSIKRSISAREEAKKAEDEQAKIRKDSITSWQKYTDDIVKINADEQQALADSEKKYADTRIQIAKQAANAAEAALNKLIEQRANLAQSFARAGEDAEAQRQQDVLDSQIKYAREEARAARDHANALLDIRQRAASDEEDLIAKRDFTGLLRSRKATNAAIDQENTRYAQQRTDRLEAFQQEADDRNRQFAFEAAQRQIKYQRDLQDAAAQYQRELNQARINQQKSLSEAITAYRNEQAVLRQKYEAQLSARQQTEIADLRIIQQGNVARLTAESQYWRDLQALMQSGMNSTRTSNGSGVGFGTGAHGTPASITYSPVYHVSGNNPEQIAKIVNTKTEAYFRALVK